MARSTRSKRYKRSIAKVICIRGVTDDLIELLEENRSKEPGEDPEWGFRVWDAIRVPIAEIMLAHLDAYDQRTD